MTDKKAAYIGLAVAGFWYYFLRGVTALKIGLKQLRITGIDGDTATLEVTLFIQNPLLAQVFVRSVSGTISIMGIPVGTIDYPINRRIKSRSITYLPVRVQISYSALGDALWANIMTGDIQTLIIELQGTITTGEKVEIPIPVRKSWTYSDIIESNAE